MQRTNAARIVRRNEVGTVRARERCEHRSSETNGPSAVGEQQTQKQTEATPTKGSVFGVRTQIMYAEFPGRRKSFAQEGFL